MSDDQTIKIPEYAKHIFWRDLRGKASGKLLRRPQPSQGSVTEVLRWPKGLRFGPL